jgi:tetratricopeptide (TPR) repeat protein
MRGWKIACLIVAVFAFPAAAQTPAMRTALADMQRGDFASAEQKLRGEVAARPNDAVALSLLGAALDNLNRIPEAAAFHTRAVSLSPHSIEVLTSYAAHLSITGDDEAARKVYLQVLGIDSSQYVANLQLARLALKNNKAPEALKYLDSLPPPQRDYPQPLLLRVEASYLKGDKDQGDRAFARLSQIAATDLNLSFAAISVLSNVRQYDKAEALCENALKAYPANFNVLFDLGVMATYAGHYGRAKEVLEAALRQRPEDVEALLGLARVHEFTQQPEAAARLLAKASQLDPRRPDVQQLLAVVATELGALDDAAAAWDRYLQLKPDSDTARRERSYLTAQKGQLEEGIAGLEKFVARHPDDVLGHYELGQAERNRDLTKALQQFDLALKLDPNHAPSRTARGSLYFQQGNAEAAVKDLEAAAALRPDDAAGLDRLGQVYQSLDRTADAVRVLRKAAELAPADSKILLHFARALADAGDTAESKTVMDRFRELGPVKQRQLPAGFVEYLNLTDEQRHADYRKRVQNQVSSHPGDAAAQVAWLKLLIEDGAWDRVAETARKITGMNPELPLLAEAGRTLLAAKQYRVAREVLQRAPAGAAGTGMRLDLAIAEFCDGDVAQALQELDRIPESDRAGDYHLARAQMLHASGKGEESLAALDQALRLAPPRADFYQQAAAYLVESNQMPLALRFLDQGTRQLPNSREILLLKAVTLELAGKGGDADGLLSEIRSRWPEWYPAWLTHGIVLKMHGRSEDSRRALDTALALGAPKNYESLGLKKILEGELFR